MKKKFSYRLSGAFLLILIAFAVICTVSACYGIFSIIGLFNLMYGSLTIEIITIVLSAILLTLTVFIFISCYMIDESTVKLKLGFWDITGGKFKIENIVKVVKATNTEKLYLNLYVGGAAQIVLINIKPTEYDNFVKCLKLVKPSIFFEQADVN